MQVLAIAATKGGNSKTTISACLGVEASRHLGRVAIADLDPQQSLVRWHQFRADVPGGEGKPGLIATGARLGSALDRVRATASPPDLLIVDCPPGSVQLTRRAIQAASLVIVPMKASPIDVETAGIMQELCEAENRPFVFLLTQIHPRRSSMTAGGREFLAERGVVLDVEITDRQSYAEAMLTGHTGPEKDKTAKAEVVALWLAIKKRLAAIKREARQ